MACFYCCKIGTVKLSTQPFVFYLFCTKWLTQPTSQLSSIRSYLASTTTKTQLSHFHMKIVCVNNKWHHLCYLQQDLAKEQLPVFQHTNDADEKFLLGYPCCKIVGSKGKQGQVIANHLRPDSPTCGIQNLKSY